MKPSAGVVWSLALLTAGCAAFRVDSHREVSADRGDFKKTLVAYVGGEASTRAEVEEALVRAFRAHQAAPARWSDSLAAALSPAAAMSAARQSGFDSLFVLEKHSMVHWTGKDPLPESWEAALIPPAPNSKVADLMSVESRGRAGEERFVNGRAFLFDLTTGRRVWWAHGTGRADKSLRTTDFVEQAARACVKELARDGLLPRRPGSDR